MQTLESVKSEITRKEAELNKLRDKLQELVVLTRLSPVYRDGKCYALAYQDGFGNIGVVDKYLETQPDWESMISYAKAQKNQFLNKTLYVVALQVVGVAQVID